MPVYTYTTLDDPSGNITSTSAFGINGMGQIVGNYYFADSPTSIPRSHGFIDSGGVYTTRDDPLGTGGTFARGINGTGQIAGYYLDNSGNHGFIYSGGTYTTLDDPLAVFHTGVLVGTVAYGINAAGRVVGSYSDNSGIHGFFYNGFYTTIDDP